MTRQDVEDYVPEPEDKRTLKDFARMSDAELLLEWNSRPQFPLGPPYPVDRNRYARLTRVRSEIFARASGKPADGLTYGAAKKTKGEGR